MVLNISVTFLWIWDISEKGMRYTVIKLAATDGWVNRKYQNRAGIHIYIKLGECKKEPAEDPGLLHNKTQSRSAQETRRLSLKKTKSQQELFHQQFRCCLRNS